MPGAVAALLFLAAVVQSCTLREDETLVDAAKCVSANDCLLVQERCCPDCRDPAAYLPMTRAQRSQPQGCSSPPKCGPPDYEAGQLECDDGYYALAAVCVEAQCAKLDLLQTAFTACERDDQCQLRAGTGCCEACSLSTPSFGDAQYYAGGLVALSDEPGYLATYCAPEITCDDCAARIPNEVSARCVAGHCRVSYDGSPITFSNR